MQPLSHARVRAWRAILSALAGGGLTVAGPVSSALASGTGTTPSSGEGTGTSTTTTTTELGAEGTVKPAEAKHKEAPPQSSTTTTTTTLAAPPPAEKKPAPSTKPAKPPAPAVTLQRKQRTTSGKQKSSQGKQTSAAKHTSATGKPAGANNVALPPQLVAGQAEAIAAALASSAASAQALGFYRIPLFLLPIYKAAAVQYGVPWQILAAINEIETDYGTDLSVSTAGAVGWMQFMPETWLQYGVDALDAGYADPYNPVDAIFAAARYLRAAGAANNLRAAILAYNHSEEYVDSVLLRAKLISTYPKDVIATLTGLTEGRLPVAGHVSWEPEPASNSSATAGATSSSATAGATSSSGTAGATPPSGTAGATPPSGTAGTTPPNATAQAASAPARAPQLIDLSSAPSAAVVAVQDGRVVQIGASRQLGRFVVLRDVYGDLFTYAGLGSIAPTYSAPKPQRAAAKPPAVEALGTHDPTPSKPASAGHQPLTLHVTAPPRKPPTSAGQHAAEANASALANGKVRLFAHPGNPDAVAAAKSAARAARRSSAGNRLPLRRGAIVSSGTVLGHVRAPLGASVGHMRFSIRPSGDTRTIDPRPVLANWAQLQNALHPRGAKAENALLGATASDVLLLSRAELERAVLSDPGVTLDACSRSEISSGKVDRRVLAVLAFLSRSGLKPTVTRLSCPASALSGTAAALAANTLDLAAINGVAIAGHQGSGTITDLTIRTLLTLPSQFVPHSITSLMRYPGAPSTHAASAFWNRIRVAFQPPVRSVSLTPAAAAAAARGARPGSAAPGGVLTPTYVSANQWEGLIGRIGALPAPTVATKPSPAAIPDPKRR